MIIDINIESLDDLHQLKQLENSGIKINISALARKLKVDRRTIKKYMYGYKKPITRNKSSQFDTYYITIKELLNDKKKEITYKSDLYRYLVDSYGMKGSSSSFRRYIIKKSEFNKFFIKK